MVKNKNLSDKAGRLKIPKILTFELISFPASLDRRGFYWFCGIIVNKTMTLSSPHEHLFYYDDTSFFNDVGGSSSISNNVNISGELLSTNDTGGGGFMILQHRLLASEDAPTVDYAILGIVVITLGLVLLVEAVRHSVSVFAV
jgi:hypothetical protein